MFDNYYQRFKTSIICTRNAVPQAELCEAENSRSFQEFVAPPRGNVYGYSIHTSAFLGLVFYQSLVPMKTKKD